MKPPLNDVAMGGSVRAGMWPSPHARVTPATKTLIELGRAASGSTGICPDMRTRCDTDEVTSEFPVRPWEDIIGFYQGIADGGGDWITPMLNIAQSVRDEGAADDLLAHTSMHDLKVTTPPRGLQRDTDYVHVELVRGQREVRIRHCPLVGPADDITRPVDDALPLFWRFMIEKYGVHPARDLDR